MNPWLWLLWAIAALLILFVTSAAFAAVWEQMGKTMTRCPRCGLNATDAKTVGRELN